MKLKVLASLRDPLTPFSLKGVSTTYCVTVPCLKPRVHISAVIINSPVVLYSIQSLVLMFEGTEISSQVFH